MTIPLPDELLALEEELIGGAVTPVEAMQQVRDFQDRTPPPWRWKAWKAARDALIGPACTQCGSTDRLTLQHLKKRPGWGAIFASTARNNPDFQLRRRARLQASVLTAAAIELSELPKPRSTCPRCGSAAIYFRKRTADWRCRGSRDGRLCGHVFASPTSNLALSDGQRRRIASKKRQAWRQAAAREMLDREVSLTKDAVLQWISNLREYLAFEDTTTFCNKCAFLWDKRGKALCPRCRSRYMPIELPACNACIDNPALGDRHEAT